MQAPVNQYICGRMRYLFPFFICALFASCFSEGDCLISATNYLHIQFKKKSNTTKDTAIQFAYQSISISGTSTFLVVRPATNEILIPVDISNETSSTTFIFHRINADSTITATDLLQVGYTKQSKVISKDCGAYTFFQNLKILNTTLDSTQIKVFNTSLVKDPTGFTIASYALNYQILY